MPGELLSSYLLRNLAKVQPEIQQTEDIFADVVPSVESNEFYSVSYIGTQGHGKSTSAAELATLAKSVGYLVLYFKAEDILVDLQGWIRQAKEKIKNHDNDRICFVSDDMSYSTGSISTKAAAKFKHFVGNIRHEFEEHDANGKITFNPKIFMIYISHRYHSLPPMLRNSPTWIFVSAQPEDKADAMKLIPRLKDEKDKLEALCSFLLKVTNDGPKYVNLEFTFGNNTMNFKWGNKEDPGDGRLMMSLHRGLLKIYNAKKHDNTIDLEDYRIKHIPVPEPTPEEIEQQKQRAAEALRIKAEELFPTPKEELIKDNEILREMEKL